MSDSTKCSATSTSRSRSRHVAVRAMRVRGKRALARNKPTSSVRLARNRNQIQIPQPVRSYNKPSSQGLSFRAIAYDDTTMTNQPIRGIAADQGPLPTGARVVHFPVSFNFYCLSFLHSRYYLGLHKTDPMYRINITWPSITLHDGLRTHSPLIGTLVHRSSFQRKRRPRSQVLLPSGTINLEEQGRFTVDVPSLSGVGTRREVFQWRSTRGPAVRLLGKHSGLKLVRLATDVSGGSGHIASGGGEAVAVLAFYGLSWRKAAAFRFQGSGAQGVLGQDWEIAAVMTAIGLWEKHERS